MKRVLLVSLLAGGLVLPVQGMETVPLEVESFGKSAVGHESLFGNGTIKQIRSKDTKTKACLMLKQKGLAVGECAELGVRFSAPYNGSPFGIVVGGQSVMFGTQGDNVVFRGDQDGELRSREPYYFITDKLAGELELTVWRKPDSLYWTVANQDVVYSGSYRVTSKQQSLPLGIIVGAGKDRTWAIASFKVGDAPVREASAAFEHPYFTHELKPNFTSDTSVPSTKHLVLQSIHGQVTEKEIQGMENYLLEFPTPTHNYENYHFRRRFMPYLYEWTFGKTGNIELLNKLIDDTRSVLAHRNDKFGKYKLIYGDVGLLWPHFRGLVREADGSVTMEAGCASISAFTWMPVTARLISAHPELWEKTYNGKTYRAIAEEMIAAALESVDYYHKIYLAEDGLLRYGPNFPQEEWRGQVLIWNRTLPYISGTIPLAEAMEKFKIKPERVVQIDRVNKAMLNFFFTKNLIYYEKDDSTYMRYPYSDMRWLENNQHTEDTGHGSFDSRDFQWIYRSGRYEFPEKFVRAFADTFADLVIVERGIYTDRLDGDASKRLHKNYSYLPGTLGYFWYAEFRPDLYEKHIDYVMNTLLEGKPEARAYWELFKLKEQK